MRASGPRTGSRSELLWAASQAFQAAWKFTSLLSRRTLVTPVDRACLVYEKLIPCKSEIYICTYIFLENGAMV